MTRNESGLKPLGRAVLLRMYEPQRKKGLIEIPDKVREQASLMENRAEVIAIGASCWIDEPEPRCRIGDKVIVTKMAGYTAKGPADGQLYRMVNDRDIFCQITKENEAHG